ncbi:replication-associated recombination protein A [Campylobacter sp. CNRCH_2016_3089]|uniref:replication-associated recombination protein A n=1 Tax=unclassified Campylobacter TaxID=2593542 RepID=UPI0021E6723C|nr:MULTISPECIES: replication-associated recombination protein A [unclassified Campylobacter]MCV3473570.1 replication-associated recombination protein A [Campylobacter sp. CNRCH_2014_2849]MCV3508410.1 replication-associated recombination protein A [Campylobacter sp. CNRCH_2016_3089]
MTNLSLTFRPKTLDEVLGQENLVEIFKKFIQVSKLPHSVFFGPAGCGKTSFARAIAYEYKLDFYEFDGGNFKLEELRKILSNYENSLYKPLIFIDEVHRLSKTQQEMLLIPLENQKCLFIGASTENPYFTLTSGIRSRSMLFEFKGLEYKDLEKLATKVQEKLQCKIDDDAKDFLITSSANDARSFLNLCEFALTLDSTHITLETLKKLRANVLSDGTSSKDTHYRLASSMIKSLRGSDVDASLYYLARLIDGGESADFIARRLVIFASEDISNANPQALNLTTSTLIAVKNIGYPEARIILAQCVVFLASSPKSNSSYLAINEALNYVQNNPALKILPYLDNNNPQRKNYLYPHDFGGWVKQRYLEKDLKFYHSKGIGFEAQLDLWLNDMKKIKK